MCYAKNHSPVLDIWSRKRDESSLNLICSSREIEESLIFEIYICMYIYIYIYIMCIYIYIYIHIFIHSPKQITCFESLSDLILIHELI